jgi:hypothetical protein
VRIDLQNAVVILVLRFATLQNKLATAVISIGQAQHCFFGIVNVMTPSLDY